MALFKRITAAFLALTMLSIGSIYAPEAIASERSSPRVVGYLPDWSYGAYKTLDFSALTHINIAFCNPNESGDISCWIPDSEFANIVEKAHNSDVKVMAALGGAGGCDSYIDYIDTPQEMDEFNEKIINFCEKHDLDGIDLDIELSSSNAVWNYYGDWVDSLRELCDEKDYELSTATAQWVAYGVSDETFAKFDFVNVMAYDNDESKASHADMDFAVKSLNFFNEKKNIPKEKLVLGVPFYGRGYVADGSLDWNSYMAYKDIIAKDPANYRADSYNGIAYNGAATIAEKCRLAADYGGIMIWELSQDTSDEYSLLKVIGDELSSKIAGDVNADGELTIADLVMMQKWLLAVPDVTLTNWKAGDLCEDNRLDSFDLVMMRKLLVQQGSQPAVTEVQVHFIDVGQGDSILIQHGENNMLIDAGTETYGKQVSDYMKNLGITSLDYVISTHPHDDHIGGMDVVLNNFDVQTYFQPNVVSTTKQFSQLLDAVESSGLKITLPVVGDTYTLGDAEFTILSPGKSYGSSAYNDWSIAIKLVHGDDSFMLCGDCGTSPEKDMINSELDLHADVFKASHHGSNSANSQTFLDAVSPTYCVISCGKNNKYGHPSSDITTRLQAMNINIFRTDEQSTIIATSDGHNITWNISPWAA